MRLAAAGTLGLRSAWAAVRGDQLARNSGLLMATTISNSALGYVFWVVAAHAIVPAELGAANAAIAAASLASLVGDVGLRTVMMTELPNAREARQWSKRVSAGIVAGVVASTVCGVACAALVALSPALRRFLSGGWLIVIVVISVTGMLFGLLDGIATAERRTEQLLNRNLLNAAVKVAVLGISLWAFHLAGRSVLVATAVSYAATVAFGILVQLRRSQPGWRFTLDGSQAMIRGVRRNMFTHHVLNLGGELPMYVLPLEVVARLSPRQNAYSSLTWMVGGVFFMISAAVSTALFVQGRWEPEEVRRSTRRAGRLIASLLAPIALFLVVFGHLVLGFFGRTYAVHGYVLLMWLLASAVPDAITNVKVGQLRARGRLKAGANLQVGMGLGAIVLVWFFLPWVGINALGIAWLSVQSLGACWCLIDDHRTGSRGSHRLNGNTSGVLPSLRERGIGVGAGAGSN